MDSEQLNQTQLLPPSPSNGNQLPADKMWKPGQSGNPAGQVKAGARIRTWINILTEQDLSEADLRALAKGKNVQFAKRAAAVEMLKTLEHGDIADFTSLLTGEVDLKQLRESGINTEIIKKFKGTSRTLREEGTEDLIIEKKVELELHDRAGTEFDRVVNTTDGTPTQESRVVVQTPITEDAAARIETLLKSVRLLPMEEMPKDEKASV